MSNLQGTVEDVKVSLLIDHEGNPQEMSPEEFNLLVEGMRDHGQLIPIQVLPLDDGTYRILGGHSRTRAAKVLGWDTISAVVLTKEKFSDRDLQDFILMRLNVLHGRLNPEKFLALYQAKVAKYGEDAMATLMGWADSDGFRKMVGSMSRNLKDAGLPKKIRARFDKEAQNAKSADDVGKILNALLAEHGSSLEANFMVFVFGGKKHLYVSCNPALWEAVATIAEHAKESGADINDLLSSALSEQAAKLGPVSKKRKSKKTTEKPDKVEGPDFGNSDDGL